MKSLLTVSICLLSVLSTSTGLVSKCYSCNPCTFDLGRSVLCKNAETCFLSEEEFEYEKKITKGCFEKPEPPQASNVTAMKYHELKMTGCVDSFVGDVKTGVWCMCDTPNCNVGDPFYLDDCYGKGDSSNLKAGFFLLMVTLAAQFLKLNF